MKTPLTALALALTTLVASAETLTQAQAGRVAIAQCYATCADRATRTSLALYERVDRLSDLLISDEYFALTDASQDAVVKLEETAICALAQDHVRGMDACHVSCVDVELVYGESTSHARTRFLHTLNAERDALREVGLWHGHAHSPASGPRFDSACDRYWQSGDGAQPRIAASRIASVPGNVRPPQRDARRARRPVAERDG